MSYKEKFEGWDNISISDLLVAYRKAKADCFFDSNFPVTINFSEYEKHLSENLNKLLTNLKSGGGFKNLNYLLGSHRILPKKLGLSPKKADYKKSHTHFSEPSRAFDYLVKTHNLVPEFRVVGDFPVDMHIISALWINTVGHKFDACLNNNNVYGARLRRIRDGDKSGNKNEKKRFHISVIGSFQQYFQPYRSWRNDGLKAIRNGLKDEKGSIIAVSLDLKSYYHLLCPDFIASRDFQEAVGVSLESEEADFTTQISEFLCKWSDSAKEFIKSITGCISEAEINGGLVIGLAASRIISNVALYKWDQLICSKLSPLHYGRYVDDMLLVMRDPPLKEGIGDSSSFMKFLSEEFGKNDDGGNFLHEKKGSEEVWEIKLGRLFNNSKIELQTSKQKLFILKGQSGHDLIDSIEKEISELSSEHRLMPDSLQFERSAATKALTAAENVAEEADTLRRADGLVMRRLGLSLQMRHAETLAHDLPKSAWIQPRKQFYDLLYNHVLRADTIFTYYKYLPRLLGLAIHLKDWLQAGRIINKSYKIILQLSVNSENKVRINGADYEVNKELYKVVWKNLQESLTVLFLDVIASSYPVDLLGKKSHRVRSKKISNFDFDSGLHERILSTGLDEKALRIFFSDLARVPYKRFFNTQFSFNHNALNELMTNPYLEEQSHIYKIFEETRLISLNYLKDFLTNTQELRLKQNDGNEPLLPFLFPTRALTPSEIAEYAPRCIGAGRSPLKLWANYVQAIRGVWVLPDSLNAADIEETSAARRFIEIGNKKLTEVTVAITNFAVSKDSWKASAKNDPDLTLNRYTQLSALVNQVIKLDPPPNYLLLPELSLPLAWVDSIANRLQSSGISLIAGTEYRHMSDNIIRSEACLVLSDDRLGYPSFIKAWQPKICPSIKEKLSLEDDFRKKWQPLQFFTDQERSKPIYIHNDFHFGVMVCSEFLNGKERISFQGQVDGLMVLAWNQDLETFSTLIESCALDVHTYAILVNNRLHGDSRMRSPAKKNFERDVARLRGGKNDFCVTVKLDISKLREFQSLEDYIAVKNELFKPIPSGFDLLHTRRYHPYSEHDILEEILLLEAGNSTKKTNYDNKLYFPIIPDEEVREKFREEILNCFINDEIRDVENAIEEAFSNIGNKIRFGYRLNYEILWHGEAGYVHNYKSGTTLKWGKGKIKSDNKYAYREISKKDWEEQVRIGNKKLISEKHVMHEKIAEKAKKLFESYGDQRSVDSYLGRKGLSDLKIRNIKYHNEILILPLMDINNKIWSLQFIGKDSSKILMKNGKKLGNFFILQGTDKSLNVLDKKIIYLVEGFATAGTIYQATDQCVIVCFDAYNIEHVLLNLIKKFPTKEYIVAADNDLWKDKNTGKEIAEALLQKYRDQINIKIKLPQFNLDDKDKSPTDFNDLHKLRGIEEVRKQLGIDNNLE